MPAKILHAVGTFETVSILDVVCFLCEIYRLSWKGQIILFLFYQDQPRCSQEQDDESLCYFTVLPPPHENPRHSKRVAITTVPTISSPFSIQLCVTVSMLCVQILLIKE